MELVDLPVVCVSGVAETIDKDLLGPLENYPLEVRCSDADMSDQEWVAWAKDAVAIVHGGDEFLGAAVLGALPDLRVVAVAAVGYESYVDAAAAREFGIVVTNAPGGTTESVAEFTLSLLLDVTYDISEQFLPKSAVLALGHTLGARKIGIVGMGNIATRLAELLRLGFGAEVSYYSRTRKQEVEERLGVRWREFDELLATSDALVVLIPGNDETKNLISEEQLAKMHHGSVLVNSSRADSVDPAALVGALRSGRLAKAAFDGFYPESSPYYEELTAFMPQQLRVTPHVAYRTHETRAAVSALCVGDVVRVLSGERAQHQVN